MYSDIRSCCCQSVHTFTFRYIFTLLGCTFFTPKVFLHELYISNHINGSRNHLNSQLESDNQVEILESGIIISMFIFGYLLFFYVLWTMWCTSPDLVNRNHTNSFRNLGIKSRFQRFQNPVDKNSKLWTSGLGYPVQVLPGSSRSDLI